MIWNIYRSWKVEGFFNFDIYIVWNTSILSESVKELNRLIVSKAKIQRSSKIVHQ